MPTDDVATSPAPVVRSDRSGAHRRAGGAVGLRERACSSFRTGVVTALFLATADFGASEEQTRRHLAAVGLLGSW